MVTQISFESNLRVGDDSFNMDIRVGKKIIIANEELIVESIYACKSKLNVSSFYLVHLSDKSYLFFPSSYNEMECIRLSKYAFAALSETLGIALADSGYELEPSDAYEIVVDNKIGELRLPKDSTPYEI
jgi:hypothetical protein